MTKTVLVVAGGAEPSLAVQSALPSHDFCVAADSGADHAMRLGIVPDVIVGDLDSISPAVLAELTESRHPKVAIEQHPTAKDMTDLELALRRALNMKADRIVVLGIDGGRSDHYLANLLALASPDLTRSRESDGTGPQIEALFGSTRLSVVSRNKTVNGRVGELLTLLAVHGPATGVTLTGVEYPLADETLHPGSARGLSNVLTATQAELTVSAGTLLVLQPEAVGSYERNPESEKSETGTRGRFE